MDLPATAALCFISKNTEAYSSEEAVNLGDKHEKLQLRATCCWVTPLDKREEGLGLGGCLKLSLKL